MDLRMHPLTYQVKRTHWNATWEAIRMYRAAGELWKEATLEDMTPARCDILQTVWDNNEFTHEMRRTNGLPPDRRFMHLASVREKLGLAGTTVWKCVRRLVELEWVELVPCEKRKRQLVVYLTALGVHALRMAQRCARTDFVDEAGKPHTAFHTRVDDFVREDAATQGAVAAPHANPEAGIATWQPARHRRPLRHWRDYYWWLIDHVRTMAKFFGCRAERLYFRDAYGQTVQEADDLWSATNAPGPSRGATSAHDAGTGRNRAPKSGARAPKDGGVVSGVIDWRTQLATDPSIWV